MSNSTNGGFLYWLRSARSNELVLRSWILITAAGAVASLVRAGGHDGPYTFLGRHYEDILLSILPHALLVLPAVFALFRNSRVANKLVKILGWLGLAGVLMALQTQRSDATIGVLGDYVNSPVLPASIAVVLFVLAIWTTFAINKHTMPMPTLLGPSGSRPSKWPRPHDERFGVDR